MSTEAPTTETPAFKIGDVVEFTGYSQALPEGMEPILEVGQKVKILAPGDEANSFKVCLVDNEEVQDTTFVEEIKAVEAAPAPAARTRTAPAKPAAAAKLAAKAAPAKPAAAVKPATAKPATPAKPAAAAKPAAKAAAPAPAKPAAVVPAKPAAKPAAAPAKPAKKGAAAAPAAKPAAAKAAEKKKADAAAEKAKADAAKQKAKEEAAAAKAAAEAAKLAPPPDTDEVAAAITGAGNDALEAAKAVAQNIKEQFFTLGGVLSHVYREKLHLLYEAEGVKVYDGEGGFGKYTEEQLDVSYPRAMALIDIYETTTKLGVDTAKIMSVGFAKARAIVRVATVDDFDAIVDFAATSNVKELNAHLATVKASRVSNTDGTGKPRQTRTPSSTSNKVKFGFTLFDDEAALAQKALAAAKVKADSEDGNKAFAFLLTEWLSLQDGNELTLEQSLEILGNKFGVVLGVVPAEAEAEQTAAQ